MIDTKSLARGATVFLGETERRGVFWIGEAVFPANGSVIEYRDGYENGKLHMIWNADLYLTKE